MKKLILVALSLALAVSAGGCLFAVHQYKNDPALPKLDGELSLPGIRSSVNIYRDDYGVPHIFADNEHDLFYAAGVVQAQDRLFEMALIRAMAQGRFSELMGDLRVPGVELAGQPLSTIALDRKLRVMGIKYLGEVGDDLFKLRHPEAHAQAQAYCDGVNDYLATLEEWEDMPLEFQLLRTRPEPFRVSDILSLGRFMGAMLAGNMDVELLRYGVGEKYGPDYAWELLPLHKAAGPTIVPPEILQNKLALPRDLPPGGRPSAHELGFDLALAGKDALTLMRIDSALKSYLMVNQPLASNNWVVSGKLTESGNAMLANDPHLEHMQPSLFYLMRLCGAGIDAYGVTFPGNPYVALGHTRKLAWGATTTLADVQDLFVETADKDHPGMYKYRGEWVPFVEREEIIRVRVGGGFVERKFSYPQSAHGPIINQLAEGFLSEDAPPIAMRWVGWDFSRNLAVFDALVKSGGKEEFMERFKRLPEEETPLLNIALMYNVLMRGESVDDFARAMDLLVLPNQAWVAADADGNIAFIPGGLVPIRKNGLGVAPVPGETDKFEWTGFIPTMELPLAVNPERGYMATANNEVVDAEWYPHLFNTNYGPGWRAWRIEELIRELAPLSMDDMKAIQNDIRVKQAEWEIPFIADAVAKKKPSDPRAAKGLSLLAEWDLRADLDSVATGLFYRFIKELRVNTLEDEMGEDDYKAYLAHGELELAINIWMMDGGSKFFDDRRTPEVEDMNDMIVKSLIDAVSWFEDKYGDDPALWRWGDLHYIRFEHPLSFLEDGLNVGPFPHLGAAHTVRNAGFGGSDEDHPFRCGSGPVLRHIMDMGKPDEAIMVIDGSQSGNFLSPHYRDLHPLWVDGKYLTADMDPERVKNEAKNTLVLTRSEGR